MRVPDRHRDRHDVAHVGRGVVDGRLGWTSADFGVTVTNAEGRQHPDRRRSTAVTEAVSVLGAGEAARAQIVRVEVEPSRACGGVQRPVVRSYDPRPGCDETYSSPAGRRAATAEVLGVVGADGPERVIVIAHHHLADVEPGDVDGRGDQRGRAG